MQGVISRILRGAGEAWAQGRGCRGESRCQDAHPLADHFDDAWGEVAHAVCAPLALVDVALPAAVGMLLKHLWQTGWGQGQQWLLPVQSKGRWPGLQLRSSSSPTPKKLVSDAQVSPQFYPCCQHLAQSPGCLQNIPT